MKSKNLEKLELLDKFKTPENLIHLGNIENLRKLENIENRLEYLENLENLEQFEGVRNLENFVTPNFHGNFENLWNLRT